ALRQVVAGAGGPASGHTPPPTQNTHQSGPRMRPSPPTRNAAITMDTATQDTVRPWYVSVAGPPAVAGLSWPPSADCPATMPEPSWSAMQAAPLRGIAAAATAGACHRCAATSGRTACGHHHIVAKPA